MWWSLWKIWVQTRWCCHDPWRSCVNGDWCSWGPFVVPCRRRDRSRLVDAWDIEDGWPNYCNVKEGYPEEAPSLKSDWLTRDFSYTACLLETTFLTQFDTRREICMAVGGFQHGDVLQIKGLRVVRIRLRRHDDSGRLYLWFHRKGDQGQGAQNLRHKKYVLCLYFQHLTANNVVWSHTSINNPSLLTQNSLPR